MNIPNIVKKYEDYTSDHIEVWPQHVNRASSAGNPCERFLVYSRLNSEDKQKIDLNTAFIFKEGNLHEKAVIDDLAKAGIRIEESQRSFEWKNYELTGKIDGMISENGSRFPVEIKSMNPFMWEKINSEDDIKKSSKPYISGYFTQMQLYLLMSSQENGLMILKNKLSGRLKQINISIDYGYAEEIIKKLERVNECVRKKEYPERVSDRSVCQYCAFKAICLPDEVSASIQIEDSTELWETLERRETLKAAAKEFDELDEKAKGMCKTKQDGIYLVAGEFQVKVKTQERTSYVVPPEIKDKYAEKKPVTVVSITALKK